MGYVPNFKCDVFVSFAHLDDVAIGSGQPWVSAFAADLKKVLRMRLGVREEEGLRVYFTGHASLEAGVDLDAALMENAASSATFVAVTSPAYVADDSYTMRELLAFVRAMGHEGRVFAIEHSPLDSNDDYPEPLRRIKRMAFWQKHPEREIPVTMSVGSEIYLQTLFDLAEQIRRQLKALRAANAAPAPALQAAAPSEGSAASLAKPNGGGRAIFLAQVTDDLEMDREQVRRYVEQYGITVLPESVYPQGGVEFAAAVERDLARSDAFVQLLGQTPARRPPDIPQGYDRLQLERAMTRNLPIMQWLRPDIDPSTIADGQHASLLAGENVMRVGLESFKGDIVKRTQKSEPPPPPSESFVFIDADGSDSDLADTLRQELARAHVNAAVPLLQGSSEDVRLDLEENLIECDALLMVYGEAAPVWVRGQLRLFSKLKHRRKQPLKALAIYLGPPETKPDIGMNLEELIEIDSRDKPTEESIRQFMAGIHQ